jgi:hypothetical protein
MIWQILSRYCDLQCTVAFSFVSPARFSYILLHILTGARHTSPDRRV